MRLIDADALREKAWDADTRCGYVQVVDVGDILEAPTIPVEAGARHRAKLVKSALAGWTACGNCWRIWEGEKSGKHWRYCPYCGAEIVDGDEVSKRC